MLLSCHRSSILPALPACHALYARFMRDKSHLIPWAAHRCSPRCDCPFRLKWLVRFCSYTLVNTFLYYEGEIQSLKSRTCFDLRSELTARTVPRRRVVLRPAVFHGQASAPPTSLLRCSPGWSPHSLEVPRLTPLRQCFRLLLTSLCSRCPLL